MADTYTTNLNLTKPEVGASADTWGNKWNTNADALDSLFPTGKLSLTYGGTGASSASGARTALGLGTLATQNDSAVAITGGTATLTSATIGTATISGGTGVFSSVTISGGSGTFTSLSVSGNAVYHTGNISSATINETQVADGALLARVGGNETVTGSWNFTARPKSTGAGGFLSYASATNTGGSVTLSTSAPSGTPAAGDLWIRYSA